MPPLTHHYLCQNLDRPNEEAVFPENVNHSQYLRIFVLPNSTVIQSNWETPYDQLVALVQEVQENPFSGEHWKPTEHTYTRFAVGGYDQIHAFAEALCNPSEQKGEAIVFVNGPTFRHLHNKVVVSHMLFESWLVWDCGNDLNMKSRSKKDADKLVRAWRGAGWFTLNHRERCPSLNIFCFDQLRAIIDEAAAELVYRHEMAMPPESFNTVMRYPIDPKRRVAQRLIRFLPRRNVGEKCNPQWRNYGFNNESGLAPLHGPIPWRGWRDHILDPLSMDMLFESWLIPFQSTSKTGTWTLQPASLLLLYWAGNLLELWEDGYTPESFVSSHDWSGWFGGRL